MAGPLFCTISSRYSFRTDSRSVAVSSAVRTALAVRLKHFLAVRTALAVSSEKINIIAVRTAPAVRSKRTILTELDASRVFVEMRERCNPLGKTLHVWCVKINFISNTCLNHGTFSRFKPFFPPYRTRDMKIQNCHTSRTNKPNRRVSL